MAQRILKGLTKVLKGQIITDRRTSSSSNFHRSIANLCAYTLAWGNETSFFEKLNGRKSSVDSPYLKLNRNGLKTMCYIVKIYRGSRKTVVRSISKTSLSKGNSLK